MRTAPRDERSSFLGLLPWPERTAVARALRTETVGGLVLLAAAVVALVWANSGSASYEAIRDFRFGIPALGLDLSVGQWTSSGLLTVFFLVAGIELKRELVVGELRTPATAALPVVAAVCGMAVPAALYVATAAAGGGSLQGWAVPMATDIAFALAVLAVLSTHLPAAMRAFLLTLAVVDDLGGILVIAVVFKSGMNLAALGGAFAGLLVFSLLQRFRVRGWWWYVPLGVAVWALMYNSGVHATVAGVAMGLILRTTRDQDTPGRKAEAASPGERTEHLLRPVSAGLAVPLFALFAAGVSISLPALAEVFTRPEPLGVVLGLVVGKTVGIFAGTYLAVRFTRARLNPCLAWADVFALAVLAGIGFTVALLIGELSFPAAADAEHVKAAVLAGSLIAAALAALLLKRRGRIYRRLWEAENVDEDADGVPDIYQRALIDPTTRLAPVTALREQRDEKPRSVDMPQDERKAALARILDEPLVPYSLAYPWSEAVAVDRIVDDLHGGLVDADPSDSSTLPITIYLSDESVHEQVEAAVEHLLAAAGGHIEHRDDPVLGSWFRRMWARTGHAVHSPLAREAAILAAHAAESRLVHAQDATVTATMLQNLGPVLAAVQPTKEVVIRAGALLIVKMNSTLVVHQLTPAQQLQLDHQPQLAQSPHDILSALELRPGSSAQSADGVDGTCGSTTPSSLNGSPASLRITSNNSEGSTSLNAADYQVFPEAST